MDPIHLTPIALIHSPFSECFGIPRQPLETSAYTSEIVFQEGALYREGVEGLSSFSHLWVVFLFHANQDHALKSWKVRPPRLGGNERMGVFATRSPFRPNPIGLSLVRLLEVKGDRLIVAGGDFLDGTPVLDLKPYVPYADCPKTEVSLPEWLEGGAPEGKLAIVWEEGVLEKLASFPESERIRAGIEALLETDPRPAYQAGEGDFERSYGMLFSGINFKFQIIKGSLEKGVPICRIYDISFDPNSK